MRAAAGRGQRRSMTAMRSITRYLQQLQPGGALATRSSRVSGVPHGTGRAHQSGFKAERRTRSIRYRRTKKLSSSATPVEALALRTKTAGCSPTQALEEDRRSPARLPPRRSAECRHHRRRRLIAVSSRRTSKSEHRRFQIPKSCRADDAQVVSRRFRRWSPVKTGSGRVSHRAPLPDRIVTVTSRRAASKDSEGTERIYRLLRLDMPASPLGSQASPP